MPMMQTIACRAAMAALALALSGCVSLGGGKPPESLITLTPDERASAGAMASGSANNAIVILDPDADRSIDVDRVPVQVSASSVAYPKDAVWVERPTRQFRRLLAETIRAGSGRIVIEGTDYDVPGKAILSGRLIDMGYDAKDQSVVVRYDALLTDGSGTVKARRFEAVVPGIPAKAANVAPALNEAANDVARQVAEWLKG